MKTRHDDSRLGMGSNKHSRYVHSFIEGLGEQTVCKILQFLDSYDLQYGINDYLNMKEDDLHLMTVTNKWEQNKFTLEQKNIDNCKVSIFLDAGKASNQDYWDISFNMVIVRKREFIKVYEWSLMRNNDKTNKRYMHFIDDWRKR